MDTPETKAELVDKLIIAQAGIKSMTAAEMIAMRAELTASFNAPAEEEPEGIKPVCDPKAAIKEGSVTCLVCGKSFKILTAKHLASHNMTPKEYRETFGYAARQPLCSKSLARERRKKMKDMQLWTRRGADKTKPTPTKPAKAESKKPPTE